MKIKIADLHQDRLSKIKSFLDLNILIDGVMLGGGSLRTLLVDDEIKDFDIFFKNLDLVPQVRQNLENLGFTLEYACPLNFLFNYKKDDMLVQLVCEHSYKDALELINTFDLSACQFAIDGDFFYTYRKSIVDTLKRRISVVNLKYPLATFRRIVKYHDKGYALYTAPREFIEQLLVLRESLIDMRGYID